MFWNLVRYEFKNVNKWYLASTLLCSSFLPDRDTSTILNQTT